MAAEFMLIEFMFAYAIWVTLNTFLKTMIYNHEYIIIVLVVKNIDAVICTNNMILW